MLTALILGCMNKQCVSSSKVHKTLVQLKLVNYSKHHLTKTLSAFQQMFFAQTEGHNDFSQRWEWEYNLT
jgi:hypothetical protein